MKKIGRPKKDNSMGRVCTIRLDDRTAERLEKYCEQLNMLKSEAIRLAINNMVDGEKIID